jgi:hypothetical protein
MLPLQPPISDDREAELLDDLKTAGIDPDTWEPDPDDLQPWWLID